ncbi:DUF3884 family protein [Bacillus cereus]|uniref:DUF3884 family protein n=1 Tax=Bacillus cereus TaxID=1396 RepID=UPI003012AC4F
MTHSKDKKSHAFKGIGEKLNPTIYQVRFMKLDEPIRFESFPELKELGDWLSTSTHMWSCCFQQSKNTEKCNAKYRGEQLDMEPLRA